ILQELWQTRADDLPIASIQEALILASIVEKETGLPEERAQVASVFVNRLNAGMRLQTDPTVIYGITRGQSTLGRGLRQSELRRETPWNTYLIDGLPPTPIANPGRAAIEATLAPAQTDYLFFVATGTGGHAFARTLAEHNENVARWRRLEAESNEN
ncbi:MAG: endolytic transglycosylase MltG, partial [Halocynthiibacter sp.]